MEDKPECAAIIENNEFEYNKIPDLIRCYNTK
jgi:hypothetical protein